MPEKHQFYFIINPVSGKGKGKKILPYIESYLNKEKITFQTVITEYPRQAAELAKNALHKFETIVAVGGDGTVNEVASALVNTNQVLGIIPIGSGNGLAREMNIPMHYEKALKVLLHGKIKINDSGIINGKFFACTAGVGFDAFLAEKFLHLKNRGLSGYMRLFFKEYLKYKPKNYTIFTDQKKTEEKALLVTVANQKQWGNNFFISPLSVNNDGLLDICILKKFPLYALPVISHLATTKQLHKSKYFKTIRSANVKIQTNEPFLFHADGEIYPVKTEIKAEISRASLKIIGG